MRLSGLSLALVLAFSNFIFAQHHPGGGGGSSGSSGGGTSAGGSSSGGGYSGGSGYSGGNSGASSHSSGGGFSPGSGNSHSAGGGYSSSGGGGHNAGGGYSPADGSSRSAGGHSGNTRNGLSGNHTPPGVHVSAGSSVYSRSRGEPDRDRVSSLVNSTRNAVENPSSKIARPIREPRADVSQRVVVPERRSFFSFLRHPFRRPQPKAKARPALYLPRPICPKGRCGPACPVGQVSRGGACVTPPVFACVPENGIRCGQNGRYQCSAGEIWNGSSCIYQTQFLDDCFALGRALSQQEIRVQSAAAVRQSACANGPAQECTHAMAAWQSEENLRQTLLARYRQCRMRSTATSAAGYGLSFYDAYPWFDSLTFDFHY